MRAIIKVISDDGVEHGPYEMQPSYFHTGFMSTNYDFNFRYSELNKEVLDEEVKDESNYSE